VVERMTEIYAGACGNADSRTHSHGVAARSVVEGARAALAKLLSVEPNEVIFTGGATESNNIALLGLEDYGLRTGRRHIVTTAIEHKSVLEPLKHLASRGFEISCVAPEEDGRVRAGRILSEVRKDTLLVSVMSANNETGVTQPLHELGGALEGSETLFHIDAAQSCGKSVKELQRANYDMMSVTAHKMYGPQGIGALVLRNRKYKKPPIQPITFGGGHESGYRPGTLPVALAAGFGRAAEIALLEHQGNWERCGAIKRRILRLLAGSGARCELNGSPEFCLPNTLNVSFLGVDSEALLLSAKQYCSMSNGSACTSRDYAHSHVLSAMGLSNERIESAIRISWGILFDEATFMHVLEAAKSLQ